MDTSTDPQHNSSPDLGLSASAASPESQLQPRLQPPPEPPSPALDEAQRHALEWLNDEKDATVTDAAEFAGVSRTTFYKWVDRDPDFRLLYLAWLQKQTRVGDGQVFATEVASVEAICDAVRDRGDLSAAKFIVKQAVARRQSYQRQLQHRERLRERAQDHAQSREDRLREHAQRREDRAREIAQRREDREREFQQRRADRRTGMEGLL
jgi:hypothetical protein